MLVCVLFFFNSLWFLNKDRYILCREKKLCETQMLGLKPKDVKCLHYRTFLHLKKCFKYNGLRNKPLFVWIMQFGID